MLIRLSELTDSHKEKGCHGPGAVIERRTRRSLAAIGLLSLTFVACRWCFSGFRGSAIDTNDLDVGLNVEVGNFRQRNFLGVDVEFKPTHEQMQVQTDTGGYDSVELVWELPNSPLRGIIFLFHGCGHSATHFWPANEGCPACIGLPEETETVKEILLNNYGAVAISSVDRINKCWGVDDLQRVSNAVKGVMKFPVLERHKDNNNVAGTANSLLPIFAIGASSGGTFVQILSRQGEINFAAVASLLAPIYTSGDEALAPPSLFVSMERDKLSSMLEESVRDGIKNNEPVEHIALQPFPITEALFYDKIPRISATVSSQIFQALKSQGFLTDHFYLKTEPRVSDWQRVLRPLVTWENLAENESAVGEVLNVAYGMHEMSSQPIASILMWFNKYGCVWNVAAQKAAHSDMLDVFSRIARNPPLACA